MPLTPDPVFDECQHALRCEALEQSVALLLHFELDLALSDRRAISLPAGRRTYW